MKNIQNIVIAIILSLFNLSLFSQYLTYAVGDTMYAYAYSGLNIRQQPDVNATVVTKVNFGQKVIVVSLPIDVYEEKHNIDNVKGHWVSVKYNDVTGYVYDGYICKWPNSSLSQSDLTFKFLDPAKQEDPYEGHQMEEELLNYIETHFDQICETVEYFDPERGKGGEVLEITNLTKGCTKINKYGWESHTLELVLPNTRFEEIKQLILYIARKSKVYEKTYKEIFDSLQSINDYSYYQEILHLPMFGISIKNHHEMNKWSIEFGVGVS